MGMNLDNYAADMAAAERRSRNQHSIIIGAILMTVGILITAATYGSASESGGTYIIAYGPIIFGAIRIIRGLAG